MARQASRPPRRSPLTRDRVLRAAIAVADAEGLDAVTMRRVGQALEVEAMSLYNHVRNKDELLDGMADLLVGEIEIPPPGTPWKDAIRGRSWSGRAVVERHPWAPALLAGRPTVRRPMAAYLDGVLAVLLAAGFSAQLAHTALHVLDSRILGFTRELFHPSAQAPMDADLLAAMAPTHPSMMRIMEEATHDDDAEFAFALDLMLDGLERARDGEAGTTDATVRLAVGDG
jgi:AcrR family transcriptional regulator